MTDYDADYTKTLRPRFLYYGREIILPDKGLDIVDITEAVESVDRDRARKGEANLWSLVCPACRETVYSSTFITRQFEELERARGEFYARAKRRARRTRHVGEGRIWQAIRRLLVW